MPIFRVLRRVDAFIDDIAKVEANTAEEAAQLADRHEAKYEWRRRGAAHFDTRLFVTLDENGNEIESTQRGDF